MVAIGTTAATGSEKVRGLTSKAETLKETQAALSSDAKALQSALDDVEKEIAAYYAEHAKLAEDRKRISESRDHVVARIEGHAKPLADEIKADITAYDDEVKALDQQLAGLKAEVETAAQELATAQLDAESKGSAFEAKKSARTRLKAEIATADKELKAADTAEDAGLFGEAYARVKLIALATLDAPGTLATDLRNAWQTLFQARETLRGKSETHAQKRRAYDDLAQSIRERWAKRSERILQKAIEHQRP